MAGLKEENLISLTGTLEAGQRMMKIGNSYIPIAPGGNFTPANIYIPDNYYKCASVDTVNKTWTGYKSIFNNGIYTFEATVTSGLTYTNITPAVNGVYSANALADVTLWEGIPSSGLVFYAPLNSNDTTAETGQAMTLHSSITYENFKGIPCSKFTGAGGISSSLDNLSGDSDRSMSIWTYCTGGSGSWITAFLHGADTGFQNFGLYKGDSDTLAWSNGSAAALTNISAFNSWYNFIATWQKSSSTLKLYVNAEEKSSSTQSFNIISNLLRIGPEWIGYLAGARVYNKVLSASEISLLANEFTPTI